MKIMINGEVRDMTEGEEERFELEHSALIPPWIDAPEAEAEDYESALARLGVTTDDKV